MREKLPLLVRKSLSLKTIMNKNEDSKTIGLRTRKRKKRLREISCILKDEGTLHHVIKKNKSAKESKKATEEENLSQICAKS